MIKKITGEMKAGAESERTLMMLSVCSVWDMENHLSY